jgi:hypothetical protein
VSTKRIRFGSGYAYLTAHPNFKPGDLPPQDASDYLGRSEWGEIQHKAGLRPVECGKCGRWAYPQELSGKTVEERAFIVTQGGVEPVATTSPICTNCAAAEQTADGGK